MRLAILKYRLVGKCIASIAIQLVLCPLIARGQSEAGYFGCPGRTAFFEKPGVPFETLTNAAKIAKWKTRPSLTFDGFNEKQYGFSKLIFYRWRISLQPGSQDADLADQAENGDATNSLALAVRLVSASADRWFELGPVPVGQNYPSADLLTIQPAQPDDSAQQQEDQPAPGKQKSRQDEMEKWISITPATPVATLPLFALNFEYHNTGANAEGTIGNELMLDVRGDAPKILKAAQCIDWDGGGACTAPDTANAVYDNLQCKWEQRASDFHCTMVSAFGGDYAARVAEKDFYLISNQPARASWQKDDTPAGLAALAVRLNKDPKATAKSVMVPKLGPVNLLARYRDLLHDSEVFLFASPAASPALGTHFSFVIVPNHGQVTVQDISKWVITGEETDEVAPPEGYTPFASSSQALANAGFSEHVLDDEYHIRSLEDRPGFHAVQVVLNSGVAAISGLQRGAAAGAMHVLYWIGMEAADGKVLVSGVRLASESSTYGSCGLDLHDGTAISVRQKPGIAEAGITVRPQDANVNLPDGEDKQSQCVWNGVLHWKAGSGFRVRKISRDCKRNIPDVSITDDGAVAAKPAQVGEQGR